MVLVLSLSIVIFVTGCTCGSLYIIILALLNDISMIPVAYDNAKATTKPQLPKGKRLGRLSTLGPIPEPQLISCSSMAFNYCSEVPSVAVWFLWHSQCISNYHGKFYVKCKGFVNMEFKSLRSCCFSILVSSSSLWTMINNCHKKLICTYVPHQQRASFGYNLYLLPS